MKHNYTLYNEKFSSEWASYCLNNGYGTLDDNGIKLPASLAKLYMTVLANEIADDKQIPTITDDTRLDNLSFFLKKTAPVSTNEIVNAKGIITLKLPANLNNIKIDNVIRIRNSDGFKKNQAAFHEELKSFLAKLETGDHSDDFIKKYSDTASIFTEQILSCGSDAISVGLIAWMLVSACSTRHDRYNEACKCDDGCHH